MDGGVADLGAQPMRRVSMDPGFRRDDEGGAERGDEDRACTREGSGRCSHTPPFALSPSKGGLPHAPPPLWHDVLRQAQHERGGAKHLRALRASARKKRSRKAAKRQALAASHLPSPSRARQADAHPSRTPFASSRLRANTKKTRYVTVPGQGRPQEERRWGAGPAVPLPINCRRARRVRRGRGLPARLRG